MIDSPIGDALARYLDLSSQQMRATATNMANIDTPGYRTEGFDFEKEFAGALGGTGTDEHTVSMGEVEGLISRPDGNNVSIDRESMQMAKTQLQFRTCADLLKHEYASMLDAIKSN